MTLNRRARFEVCPEYFHNETHARTVIPLGLSWLEFVAHIHTYRLVIDSFIKQMFRSVFMCPQSKSGRYIFMPRIVSWGEILWCAVMYLTNYGVIENKTSRSTELITIKHMQTRCQWDAQVHVQSRGNRRETLLTMSNIQQDEIPSV